MEYYKTPAVSGRAFTARVGLCGRINAKPTRKIPYAVNTPNAIEPTVAHTNIVKFSTSAMGIFPSLLHKIYNDYSSTHPQNCSNPHKRNVVPAILAENLIALTLVSVAK